MTKYSQETADLFTFTEEFLNGKIHFFVQCSGGREKASTGLYLKIGKKCPDFAKKCPDLG